MDVCDRVRFEIPLENLPEGRLMIVAWLHYQPIPPRWVAPLRTLEAEAAQSFVGFYDEADKTPDTLALTVGFID